MKYFSELKDLLFIDIETLAFTQTYEELSEEMQQFWLKKVAYSLTETETVAESYERRSALLAEFSKVIVIGIGYFYQHKENDMSLRIKSFVAESEKELLTNFAGLLNHKFSNRTKLVAHNGKEFDYPYLCRRMLINEVEIPKILQSIKGKSWDNPHLDTMEMWRFGDRRNFTALRLVASLLGVSPCQGKIDGSEVHKIYYTENGEGNGLDRIAKYCRCDVRMTAEIYLKMKGLPSINPDNIVEV
jgi:uncharacterized protein YprB with RNaseH-like and TPR domain